MALAMGGFVVGILEQDFETAVESIDPFAGAQPFLGPGIRLQLHHPRLQG